MKPEDVVGEIKQAREQMGKVATVNEKELVLPEITNKREIPEARFIDKVEEFVGNRKVEDVVAALQDLHAKYKYTESGLSTQTATVRTKLPEIEGALELVQHLQKKRQEKEAGIFDKDLQVNYMMSENIWAHAEVPLKKDTIMLWLGANTLLEYTFEEAAELLLRNKTHAEEQQVTLREDMSYLKNQIVMTEVNIARCHNYGVLQRQKKREEELLKEEKGEADEEK